MKTASPFGSEASVRRAHLAKFGRRALGGLILVEALYAGLLGAVLLPWAFVGDGDASTGHIGISEIVILSFLFTFFVSNAVLGFSMALNRYRHSRLIDIAAGFAVICQAIALYQEAEELSIANGTLYDWAFSIFVIVISTLMITSHVLKVGARPASRSGCWKG